MKRFVIFLLLIISTAALVWAQEEDQVKGAVSLGAGLTKKPIAGFTVIAAEDAYVSSDGKQAFVESAYDYVVRKFKVVEARLQKIELMQEELKIRIKHLEKNLNKVRKIIPRPPAQPSLS